MSVTLRNLGFYWFEMREWNYYPAGPGLYYPLVLWVTLARTGEPAWLCAVPVATLTLVAGWAAWRLARLIGPQEPGPVRPPVDTGS